MTSTPRSLPLPLGAVRPEAAKEAGRSGALGSGFAVMLSSASIWACGVRVRVCVSEAKPVQPPARVRDHKGDPNAQTVGVTRHERQAVNATHTVVTRPPVCVCVMVVVG